MIVEIVAANAAISHGDQVPMKTADDGDEVHPVLNLVGIICRFSFGFVGAVGSGRDMIVLLD